MSRSHPSAPHWLLALVAVRTGSRVCSGQRAPASARSPRPSSSLIPLQTRLRYTTMIVLPEGEEILDVICGDKDFWVISATQNIAHVKPAKDGATTNLNLVTSSGAIYSFLLTEKERHRPARPQGLRRTPTRTRRRASRSTTAQPRSRVSSPS